MTINAIIIAADVNEPIRSEHLDQTVRFADSWGDEHIEIVDLYQPRARMYVDEIGREGPPDGWPVNPRATALAWLHNRQLRGRSVIAGTAVILGIPDGDGVDTAVPRKLAALLLGTGLYRAEVQIVGENRWYGNSLVFPDWFMAYVYAIDLADRWTLVRDMRVVPVILNTDQRDRG